ncbi:hypothetical protein [Pseudoxanthomonas suwonensis]|uniref:Secreted protein n=1 Tax=Pseudoxanthomonas suwonensis TaxID=314722 RepID=A0A0E3YZZ1_9GAMM|nr:hypothetical protein [Pseudoxanthomonas suwonensis]AKC86223.1 hypothetical protein WQ53_04975 [Pseudoxanthomonas suwonensis]
MKTATTRTWLFGFAAALLLAMPAWAGPPLLCDPFDTAGAPSLAWGGDRWNQPLADYDLDRLATRTEALLAADTPVIARMETLRRAAIYASRDGRIARQLASRLDARIAAAGSGDAKALALFDSGYFLETLQEVVRLQSYDMPGVGPVDTAALRALLAQEDGSARIDRALALRPDDPSMRFAAALVARADQRAGAGAAHAQRARAGAEGDRLLALNIGLISP